MCRAKIIFILTLICLFSLFPQKVKAGTLSDIADKTIEFTAKTAYYITKYTLKSGWFITRKTAKGVKIVSKSMYNAAKDTFTADNKKRTPIKIKKNPKYKEYDKELPPPPPILD